MDKNKSYIGKYNETNNLVIILNGNYSLKEDTPQKKEISLKNVKGFDPNLNSNQLTSNINTPNNNPVQDQSDNTKNYEYSDGAALYDCRQKIIEEKKQNVNNENFDEMKKNIENKPDKTPIKYIY